MAAPASNHQRGLIAEDAVVSYLERENWRILARRLRTPAGEIDLVAERNGLLMIGEVKSRANLAIAAESLSLRQRQRLLQAAEIALAQNDWRFDAMRFDVFLVDRHGDIRRIEDAFRIE